MNTPSLQESNLWIRQYKVLTEIHAVGMQILIDAQLPNQSRLPNHWGRLDQLWKNFQELSSESERDLMPADPELRANLLTQAKANADLFRSLQHHCLALQENIKNILPRVKHWGDNELVGFATSTIRVKA